MKAPDRIRDGEARLLAAGLGPDSSLEELAAALGRDPETDLAIVHRLGAVVTAESAALLRSTEKQAVQGRLPSSAKDLKELRKEIKRSLYRLEQRGLSVPSVEVESRPPTAVVNIEGYTSAFDGRGDRLVWLVKAKPGGVLHLFGVVNEPDGLREVAINRLTRKALREIQDELRRKHEIRLVSVDWRWADWVMQRGLEAARHAERPVDGDYQSVRSQITAEPVCRDLAGPLASLRPELAIDEQHFADCAEILLEPEMRTWLLADDLSRKAVDELMEIRSSPLVLNEAQLNERFQALNDRIVEDAFGGAAAEPWARRLEETAYYFAKTSRQARAAQAAAAALALRDGRPVTEIPFCVIYVRRTLGLYLGEAEKREEAARRESLVLTPDQARKRRS